jgi:hypothetical protein
VQTQAPQTGLRRAQAGEGEVQPRAVMRRQAQVPKRERLELQPQQIGERVGVAG